jgi:hypothetical protein
VAGLGGNAGYRSNEEKNEYCDAGGLRQSPSSIP